MNTKNKIAAMTKILERAEELGLGLIPNNDRVSLYMDIEGSNVDIFALATTDNTTFTHDIVGIYNHYNRFTKKLENCFVPRVGFLKNN